MNFSRHISKLAFVVASLVLSALSLGQEILNQGRTEVQGRLELHFTTACRDAGGNFYITGTASSYGSYASAQVITQKISSNGTTMWTHSFSNPPVSECFPQQIAVDSHGEVYVAGFSQNATNFADQMFIVKISSAGSTLWSKLDATYKGVSGLAVDATGNAILAAYSGSYFNLNEYNSTTGAVTWSKEQKIGSYAALQSLQSSGDHIYALILAGVVGNQVLSYSDATGATLWQKGLPGYGSLQSVSPTTIAALGTGDVVVGGSGSATAGAFSVATFDRLKAADGSFVYRKTVGPETKSMYGTVSTLAADGEDQLYYSAVFTNGTTNVAQNAAGKIAFNGNEIWLDDLPKSSYDAQVVPTSFGYTYVTCVSEGRNWFEEILPSGAIGWTEQPITYMTGSGLLFVDGGGNLSFVGGSQDSVQNTYYALLTLGVTNGSVKLELNESPIATQNTTIYAGGSNAAATDVNGNVYVTGSQNLSVYVAMYNSAGKNVWRTLIQPTNPNMSGAYPCGLAYSPSTGTVAVVAQGKLGPVVSKLVASTGQIQWTKFDEVPNPFYYFPDGVKIDPEGNVDVGIQILGNTIFMGAVQYGTASGAVDWRYSALVSDTSGQFAMDTSGSIYLVGFDAVSNPGGFKLAKISSAGKVQFLTTEQAGTTKIVYTGIQYDPGSNNIYLFGSDMATVNSKQVPALEIGRYNTGGGKVWEKTIPLSSYGEPTAIQGFFGRSGNLYLVSQAGELTTQIIDTLVHKVSSSGALLWQNICKSSTTGLNSDYNGAVLDEYENVIIAGTASPTLGFGDDQVFARKVDGGSGGTRWSMVYRGTYASGFAQATAVTVGPDDEPVVLGMATSATGPGALNALTVKLIDASAPICFDSTYTCTENTALPPTDPSVLASAEDLFGGTAHVVSGPAHAAKFSLSANGQITYTPATGFVGTDTFTFNAKNAYGTSNTATVTIKVVKP